MGVRVRGGKGKGVTRTNNNKNVTIMQWVTAVAGKVKVTAGTRQNNAARYKGVATNNTMGKRPDAIMSGWGQVGQKVVGKVGAGKGMWQGGGRGHKGKVTREGANVSKW